MACYNIQVILELEFNASVESLHFLVCLQYLKLTDGLLRFQIILEIDIELFFQQLVVFLWLEDLKPNDSLLRLPITLQIAMRQRICVGMLAGPETQPLVAISYRSGHWNHCFL